MDQNPNSSKADRKTIEKNRRNQMKTLCSRLSSLVPHQPPKEVVSLPDQLEGATNYIKKLQTNIEKMKQKKNCLMGMSSAPATATANSSARSSCSNSGGLVLPNVDVRVVGSAVEVALVTGLNCQFMFTETLRLLHEEGAEVLNASFSVLDNSVFHTIHCQIGESAQGYGAARISERLRKYVYDVN